MSDLLISYYGDDFTGSTDVMEALTRYGVKTRLFLEPPTRQQLTEMPDIQAIGIAGVGRTLSPEAMEAQFPSLFTAMKNLGAHVTHYKICSTFDSSPQVGSIGKAIDIGHAVFESPFVPLLVAIPLLGRWCAFGNLFAKSGLDSPIFRLDEHPTMRQHPITPMNEANLAKHLALQTDKKMGLFDVLQLAHDHAHQTNYLSQLINDAPKIVIFDAIYDDHIVQIGTLMGAYATAEKPLFVVGSSGVEQALVAFWKSQHLVKSHTIQNTMLPVEQLLVVSGSVSPVTARQINHAIGQGFHTVQVETHALVHPNTREYAIADAVDRAKQALYEGASVIVNTAQGHDDERTHKTREAFAELGYNELDIKLRSGVILGSALGEIAKRVLNAHPLPRLCVAGGDTSSYVVRQMGIHSLEVKSAFQPAMPLCRAFSDGALDGLEMIFKGGQTGKDDFFVAVRGGENTS
jgi:3-oxoisoapionate kinase